MKLTGGFLFLPSHQSSARHQTNLHSTPTRSFHNKRLQPPENFSRRPAQLDTKSFVREQLSQGNRATQHRRQFITLRAVAQSVFAPKRGCYKRKQEVSTLLSERLLSFLLRGWNCFGQVVTTSLVAKGEIWVARWGRCRNFLGGCEILSCQNSSVALS